YDSYKAARQAARLARNAGPMTEAQWFYQLGLRQRQQGDEPAARRTWQALIRAFGVVPSEQPWVALSEKMLAGKNSEPIERDLEPVRESVRQAKELKAAGKPQPAADILSGLRALYGEDPGGREIVDGK